MTPEQYDNVLDKLSEIRSRIAAIEVDVAYHIKRTQQLEDRYEDLHAQTLKLSGFISIGGWLVALLLGLFGVAEYMGIWKKPL